MSEEISREEIAAMLAAINDDEDKQLADAMQTLKDRGYITENGEPVTWITGNDGAQVAEQHLSCDGCQYECFKEINERCRHCCRSKSDKYCAKIVEKPPVGTMIFYLDDVPDGYLACDGAEYKVSDYPELAKIIGIMRGVSEEYCNGDTFRVPNFRHCSICVKC